MTLANALQPIGSDSTTILGTGDPAVLFTFPQRVPYLGSYTVTVSAQPANQTCSISGTTGSGSEYHRQRHQRGGDLYRYNAAKRAGDIECDGD